MSNFGYRMVFFEIIVQYNTRTIESKVLDMPNTYIKDQQDIIQVNFTILSLI